MSLLIFYVSFALGASFLCSLLEAVILSITPSYVARMEEEGKKTARALRELKARVDRPLASILSLNTIANTAGAAGVGAQAQKLWGSSALAIASAALTLLVLVLSEIIPKTIGATFWRRLAPFAARILPVMIVALYPFVLLSQGVTKIMDKQAKGKKGHAVSREEIAAMARLGIAQGLFAEPESRMLKNLLHFGSLRVRDIMTPRTVLVSVQRETTVEKLVENKMAMRFSRIPVWGEDEDDIVGYVLKDEALLAAARDQMARPVSELERELLVVPESSPVATLFDRLLDEREHIALIVDEYGGVAGVATMEDVVETLLGLEIVDEADIVRDMRDLARARWYERARRLGLVPSQEEPADK